MEVGHREYLIEISKVKHIEKDECWHAFYLFIDKYIYVCLICNSRAILILLPFCSFSFFYILYNSVHLFKNIILLKRTYQSSWRAA